MDHDLKQHPGSYLLPSSLGGFIVERVIHRNQASDSIPQIRIVRTVQTYDCRYSVRVGAQVTTLLIFSKLNIRPLQRFPSIRYNLRRE